MAKYWSLSSAEKMLVVEAACFVIAARLVLAARRRKNALKPLPALPAPLAEVESPERISWAVGAVSRRVPGALCLAQALAGEAMLQRRGLASEIRIGVATAGTFRAHAWLVRNGCVLLGGGPGEEYTDMGTIGSR